MFTFSKERCCDRSICVGLYLSFILLICQFQRSQEENKIVSFTANNQSSHRLDPVWVNIGSDLVVECTVNTILQDWYILLKNESYYVVAYVKNEQSLSYISRDVHCQLSGTFTCQIASEFPTYNNLSVDAQSTLYVMVSKCLPKLCHGQEKRKTIVAPIGSKQRVEVCVILEMKMFMLVRIFVNGEYFRWGQRNFHFQMSYNTMTSTSSHIDIYIDFKKIEGNDYKTYVFDVQFGNVKYEIFTLELIGLGDKCPKHWCESDDKKCLHINGPIHDYKLAQQTCSRHNGLIAQNLEVPKTNVCLKEKLQLLNSTTLVTIDAKDVCTVKDIHNTTRDGKLSCREIKDFSEYLFLCQLPFWASSEENKIVSFTANNQPAHRLDPVWVNIGSDLVIECTVNTILQEWYIRFINDSNDVVAQARNEHVITYTLLDVRCRHSGAFTCQIVADFSPHNNLTVYTNSTLYVMVTKCPPKLCHGQRNRETKEARLGSYPRITACVILDKKLFNYYKVFVNGEHYYIGQKSLNYDIFYDVPLSTPIHFVIYLDFNKIGTKDYKTYYIVVQFENVEEVILTLDLIGKDDKCPKDWCESDDQTCSRFGGPIQNYKVAKQTCDHYNGLLARNLEILRTQMCLRAKLQMLNTSSLVYVNAEDVCTIMNINSTERNDNLNCKDVIDFNEYYYVCQIPFWTEWPPKNRTSESTTTDSAEAIQYFDDDIDNDSFVALDVTTLTVITVTLLLGGMLVGVTYCIIKRVRGTNKQVNEMILATNEHHYDTLQQTGLENHYREIITASEDHQTTDLKAFYNV